MRRRRGLIASLCAVVALAVAAGYARRGRRHASQPGASRPARRLADAGPPRRGARGHGPGAPGGPAGHAAAGEPGRHRHLGLIATGCVLVLALAVAAGYVELGRRYQQRLDARVSALTRGDPARGHTAIARYGCGSCHTIPGITGARGRVGPPLTGVGQRAYIAGQQRNTPDNLVAWIRYPRHVAPHTAMPELGVTEQDARDIAAYLYARGE